MSIGSQKKSSNTPSENTSLANPITHYRDKAGNYPNNSQIWWAMKRPPEVGTDRPPKTYLEVFDPSLRHQIYTGNTPSPKGHYIVNAFHQDRSQASGVSNIPVTTSNGARPQAVAFYAGRVFYAGVFTSGFNTKVYFTQILERPEQVAECYQAQDPTSEDLRDLLPSDGGVLVIPEVVQIIHMQAIDRDLYIFGSNGVWRVGGSEGLGFVANDYSVTKISGAPTVSSFSFVDVEGLPIWWNRSSINTMVPNQAGMLQVQSLTDRTIKSLYNEIPEESKYYAKGSYDPLTGVCQWLYRSTVAPTPGDLFNYDRILVLDTQTGAWYPYTLPSTGRVDVKGIFTLSGKAVVQAVEDVYVDDEQVLADADEVAVTTETRRIVDSKIKYIVNITE